MTHPIHASFSGSAKGRGAIKAKPSENQVVNACLRWLLQQGCYVWRNNTGAYKPQGSNAYVRYGTKGSADIIGVTPTGQFIAVEAKAGKNTQSTDQRHWQSLIEDCNGLYILAYSVDDLERHKAEIVGRV